MAPKDAYEILEAIAEINGQTDKLIKVAMSAEDQAAVETAEEVDAEHKERLSPFAFSKCNIVPGDEVEWYADSNLKFKVLDDKNVEYQGRPFSLSSLATLLTGSKWSVAGPRYFKYKGERLNDIRQKL